MSDDRGVRQRQELRPSGAETVGSPRRSIGPLGTAARVVVGGAMTGGVLWGNARSGFDVGAWIVGLGVLPAMIIAAHGWRVRRDAPRLVWLTGPLGHALTVVVFMALYLTWWYAPAVSVLSDAALLFYGTSMLVAAGRGHGGCEVLAVSNWVLRRDDQVGCLLFEPIDQADEQRQ